MIEIIPAVIPKSYKDLKEKLDRVANFVKMVQIDVMDGKFVSSKNWPYNGADEEETQGVFNEDSGLPHWENVDFELDMMVAHPEVEIERWIIAGAKRLIVHIESTTHVERIIRMLEEKKYLSRNSDEVGIELGLALGVETSYEKILPYLEDIQFVQFMGIAKIGYQGQPFDERVVDHIRNFHNAHPEVIISVDGGVNLDTAKQLVDAGAKRLVSGSTIFDSENVADTLKQFKEVI